MTTAQLLDYVGANKTSHDVHWPLSLSLRPKHLQNFRKRGKEALERRSKKKAGRGYTQWPPASWGRNRASGSGASGSQDQGWRSSSSGWRDRSSWSGWQDWSGQ